MGRQVQIVAVGPDNTLHLNEDELKRLLMAPTVKDKPVAVVSIMGAFRQGKSFLLNFLLRYLRSGYKSNWMGDQDTPLEGFSWSGGTERNTIGINVWDEVFLVPTSAGDKLAVLLMDTQGAFDSKTSADETANLSAISILTSSVQIYNISKNIQEDHLQHLQLVAEYGMETHESTAESQFQKLVFLIRDWQFPDDKDYGAKGGRIVLEEFLSTSAEQPRENIELRQNLSSCFSSIGCFLMPHPGKASTRNSFDGRLSKLDEDFKEELGVLVPWLVGPGRLNAKKVSGTEITCQQLLKYFKVYTDVFKDGKRPHVATILQATAEENNRIAKEEAKMFYLEQMKNATWKSLEELEEVHDVQLKKAKEIFEAARRMGGDEVKARYLKDLLEEIKLIFSCFHNNQKILELQEEVNEMKATSDKLSKELKELEVREKELQREKQQLASKSSEASQKQKALDEKEEALKRQREELERTADDFRYKTDALRQEQKQLLIVRNKLMWRAKETFQGTDIWDIIIGVLSLFPPLAFLRDFVA